jgi:hypothetical protein
MRSSSDGLANPNTNGVVTLSEETNNDAEIYIGCPRKEESQLKTFIVKINKAIRVRVSPYETETLKVLFTVYVTPRASLKSKDIGKTEEASRQFL